MNVWSYVPPVVLFLFRYPGWSSSVSCLDTFIRERHSQNPATFLDSGDNRLRARCQSCLFPGSSANPWMSLSLSFQVCSEDNGDLSYDYAGDGMKLYFENSRHSRSLRKVGYLCVAALPGIGGWLCITLHTKQVSNNSWLNPGSIDSSFTFPPLSPAPFSSSPGCGPSLPQPVPENTNTGIPSS